VGLVISNDNSNNNNNNNNSVGRLGSKESSPAEHSGDVP